MISGKAKVAGIVGWPVSHSRSPRLHGYWLREHGIDGAYVPLPVPPGRVEQALRALPLLGLRGCNVTVPHKEAAFTAMDRLDPVARRIGAVNTVVVLADGSLEGRNTDGYGFLENLLAGAPGWRPEAAPAVVIGAGGAARAVAVALLEAGCPELRLANRTRARAEEMAAVLGGPVRVVDWAERADALAGAGLLVNTTTQGMGTQGMGGQPALDLALDALPETALVNDCVYTPLETPLLAAARARGNPVVDGAGMLLHQGRKGFEAWFGPLPAVTAELRAFVMEGL